VTAQQHPELLGEGRQVGAPVSGWWRVRIVAEHGVHHEVEQLLAAVDASVQRGARSQRAGDPTHGHGLDTLGVGQGNGGADSLRQVRRRATARASDLSPCQRDGGGAV
jgi:hypothetical protein